jgi:hypothetical protein
VGYWQIEYRWIAEVSARSSDAVVQKSTKNRL